MKDLQVINQSNNAPVVAEDYKQIAIQWLTSTGNLKTFTENEKSQFCDICCAYGLNPIKKEVYGVKYKDHFNIIVGYESYIKRAERSGQLNGWNVEIVGSGDDMKAVITIHRRDWDNPFVHEVYFSEYNTKQNLWISKPKTMLKKVAIAQGFRMCFSEVLGGIPYTADELPEEMSNPTPIEKDSIPVLNVSDKPQKKSNKIAPAFTKEQSLKLKELMLSEYSDGSPIFNDKDKAEFRELLKNGQYEFAMSHAQDLITERQNKLAQDKANEDAVNTDDSVDAVVNAFDGEIIY